MGGGNFLIEALPAGARATAQAHLTRVSLVQRQVLWNPDERIGEVFFPVSALVSIVAHGGKRADVEVAAIGRLGMVGLPVFLGDGRSPNTAMVQIPGEADRMPVAAFRELVVHQPELRRLLQRFAQAFTVETAQGAVCNCHHRAERRLARWLLTAQDRCGRSEFPLTHEFISQLLGMRRATVTGEVGRLQSAGLVRATPGRMILLDRPGLERLACECYGIISEEYRRLLAPES